MRPNVRIMEPSSMAEHQFPAFEFDNLVSWYRYLAQDQYFTDILRDSLKSVWPDLKFLKLVDAGMSVKVLQLHFEGAEIPFSSLSDGEKMLMALYMLHAALEKGSITSILIDEPDNFISLQELQPWMLLMCGLIDDSHQVIIISHNPEILENNASSGTIFWRDNHGSPTRAGPLEIPEGLTIRDAIVRGWIYPKNQLGE
jgi:ATPase subunit of ABC transporter with duplicated ATPase domains